MCGIVGWVNLKKDIKPYYNIVEDMRDTLVFRGPDSYGIKVYDNAILGHRRLAIVDPTGGLQPMDKYLGDRKYTIVYNGELYNTEVVRRDLLDKGYTFNSYSDKELFLVRDPLGVKPLFYSFKGDSLIFGSEIKALLKHPDVDSIVDKDGILEMMAISPQRSLGSGIFKDIKEVPPAYCLTYNENGIKLRQYWELEAKEHTEDLGQTTKHLRELLVDAIERQLVSDVPVCTFLSGGLDSSFISYIAAKAFERDNKEKLNTFSIDYTDNEKYFKANEFQPNSDAYWVVKMADYIKSNHHNVILDNTILANYLKEATLASDLPLMADIDSSLYLFSKEVRKHATVVLSGECADEVFGGYPWYTKDYENIEMFPWQDSLNHRKNILAKSIADLPIEEYAKQMCQDSIKKVPKVKGESKRDERMRELTYLNLKWFMITLLNRKDRMTMANSLEGRVPYADKTLVEYAYNIPADMKLLHGREKGLLRESMRTLLPDEIIDRKKSPYPKTHNPIYTKAVCKMLNDIAQDPNAKLFQIVDKEAVINMINTQGRSFTKPWFGQLMTGPQVIAYLIQLETWLNEYNVKLDI